MMTRRIAILICITAIALCIGILWPGKWLVRSFHHTGFYFITISVFLWLVVFVKSICGEIKPFFKKHYSGLILSFVMIGLVFIMSPPYFKILADESNLIGTSMSMHQNKTTSFPHQGLNLDFEKFKPATIVNKRPMLFPFVVSIFHSVLGYSPYNGFIVNFICGTLILFLFYVFIYRFYPHYLAILSILVFAANPIFSIWITSSGFEGLNLLFILIFLIAYHNFLLTKDAPTAELLFLSFILLIQCRYESLIFGIVLLTLLPHLLRKDMIRKYSFFAYSAPLLIIPILWQRRLFLSVIEPVRMSLGLIETSGQGFNLHSLGINASKNIYVFSGIDPNYGFILIISILSIVGAYLLIKDCILKSSEMTSDARHIVFTGVVMFLLLFLIYSSYQWGNFRLPISNRLAIVFLPFFVFASIHFIHKILSPVQRNAKIFLFALWSFVLVYFWPYASNQILIHTLQPTCEYNKILNYIDFHHDHELEKILLISDRPNQYFIHGHGAIDFAYANSHSAELKSFFTSYFDRIFVLQRYSTANQAPLKDNELNSAYQLNATGKIKCSFKSFIRISEVLEIN